jgi:hypothetical protein
LTRQAHQEKIDAGEFRIVVPPKGEADIMESLGVNIQIIVQTEQPSGDFACEGFAGFPTVNPCLIVIATAGTPDALKWADLLRAALVASLTSLSPTRSPVANVNVPCGGTIECDVLCHAHKVLAAQKLLILVGDPFVPIPPSPMFTAWESGDPTYRVLPVFPAKSPVTALLGNTRFAHRNAVFWHSSIEEVALAALANAGLTTVDHRLFVSYSRPDTADLAEQLFEALAADNFDVYVDRFRTPPTVDFRLRIEQELADKAMVLILESRNLGKSKWCQHEITTAKKWRLGLLGLRMPDGIRQRGVRNRLSLNGGDFKTPAYKTLTDAALAKVCRRIKYEHDRMLVYRRWYTRRSFELELRSRGAPPSYDADGSVHVTSALKATQYAVWLTTRTPDLADFQRTDGACRAGEKGLIIGTGVAEPGRRATLDWLTQKSAIRYADEGKLIATARQVAEGTL